MALASKHGEEISQFCNEYGVFQHGDRWVEFWMNEDSVQYHLSGKTSTAPAQIAETRPDFRGIWDETGSLPDLEQAILLLRAWLIDRQEIDDLPDRLVRRWLT